MVTLKFREEAGVGREAAVSEFVRESAYTWANRLFALTVHGGAQYY
jgi:hypothetical protein